MPTERLSLAAARRIAVAAQGLAEPRPTGRVDRRHFRRALDRMGLIQIDAVNVLVRSQELPLFSRLGPHPRTMIHDATRDGELFEYWAHEASHIRTAHHQLHRWKMADEHQWGGVRRLEDRRPGFIDEIHRRVEAIGPVVAGEFSERIGPKQPWWDWDDAKLALEFLFWKGRLTATRRPSDFARVYDLTERVLPAEVLARPTPTEDEARKELLVLAASHHGVATLGDLADYHRQKPTRCRPLVDELVEDGRLQTVEVEGWDRPAYLAPGACMLRSVRARAVLSPFDPLVWNRDRTERLFGFRYRIEIYTPQTKRQYGYYVLPFLLDDQLVARVDLKADRARRTLVVPGAFGELGVPTACVVDALAAELASLAGWLGLEHIEVGAPGDLASPLRGAVDHYARL